MTSESKIRYCVTEGCNNHTKEPRGPVIAQTAMKKAKGIPGTDMSNDLVCPWCAEEECGHITICGEDVAGVADWVKVN